MSLDLLGFPLEIPLLYDRSVNARSTACYNLYFSLSLFPNSIGSKLGSAPVGRIQNVVAIGFLSLTSSFSDLSERFGLILLRPNQPVVDRLLLLLEQILEDEQPPGFTVCMHQRATLVELSKLDRCEPELFGQIRHRRNCVLLVTRQKDDPVAAFDDRIGSEGRRN